MKHLLFALFSLVPLPAFAEFKVTVNGLKNTTGDVCLLVFDKADGYPDDHTKAIHRLIVPAKTAKNHSITFVIQSATLKGCAFVALHDENSNKKVERNLIGIPKEGVAMSRGVSVPPKFSKAVIQAPKSPLTLKLKYW